MKKYNPKYDTKIQPFNISIIKNWIENKDLKELNQWLQEGEPHKRLIKEAIYYCTVYDWIDGLKILFKKDWISLGVKINTVISKINHCEKDDIWIYIRDIVFLDKKLVKNFSFNLFWQAKENGKEYLFDEDKIDFSHNEATSILTYRYMFPDENSPEKRKEEYRKKRDYLLSKPVYFIPYNLISLMNVKNASYVVEMLKKHKNNPIFKTKEELFVFACVVGAYYQGCLNHVEECNKGDEEKTRILEEQRFMFDLLNEQGVPMKLDITPKLLNKNGWINQKLENNYGDFCSENSEHLKFGRLKLKYFRKNESEKEQKLPEKQEIKLAWYWIGGDKSKRNKFSDKDYKMTACDKIYAEKKFDELFIKKD